MDVQEPVEQTDGSSVSDPIIEARNVSVLFEMEAGTSRVLDEVSVNVERDETLGIVGESGSGKSMFASTLLDAIVDPGSVTGSVTYNPPNGNSIEVLELDDEELREFRWEEIAMVFQGAMAAFNPTLSIKGHFEETLSAHGYEHDDGMERARQLLREVHLEPERVFSSYPHELSGGMKQRSLIALSLLLDPEILILDEPTAALDLLMQRSILSLLEDIKEEYNLTILFISHDLAFVARMSDRLAVMYAFEFAEIGGVDDVIQRVSHPYTRALLSATPDIYAPLENMKPIEGSSPNPMDVPSGCSFHPRCPLAKERCVESNPPLIEVSDSHRSACFYSDDVEPLTIGGGGEDE